MNITRQRWKWRLFALGFAVILACSTFYINPIGEYFGSGSSFKDDSIDLIFKYFYDWEIKAIISARPFPAEVDSDEIEVYKAIFDSIAWKMKPSLAEPSGPDQPCKRKCVSKVIIQEETYWQPEIKWDSMMQMVRRYGSPWMIYDFHRKNALWPRKHDLQRYSSEVYSITRDEESRIFQGPRSWDNYHKEFPAAGCIHGISRVGFSWDRKKAILHSSWQCGPLWGEGNLLLLEKKDGKWIVIKKIMTWIS